MEKAIFIQFSSPMVHNYSSIMGFKENGYGAMPKIEETLVAYLSPEAVSSLKAPTLPSKPCRTTSSLVGKAYMVSGQTGACLHTMDILHAYQAELSGDLDRAESMSSDNIRELRRATDLTLRATKETARAVG